MVTIKSKIGAKSYLYYTTSLASSPVWTLFAEIVDDKLTRKHTAVDTSSRSTRGQKTFGKGLEETEISFKHIYEHDDAVWDFLEGASRDTDDIYFIARVDVPIADADEDDDGDVLACQLHDYEDDRPLDGPWMQTGVWKQVKNANGCPTKVSAL